MNAERLKQLLIEGNKKDIKFTFIKYELLYITLFTAILVLLYFYSYYTYDLSIFDFISKNFTPYNLSFAIIFSLLISGFVFFPLYHVLQVINRKKEINRLMKLLKSESKAHTFKSSTTYKVKIPLGKKTINIFPITMLYTIMDKDNRPFKLPIDEEYISEIKAILT